MPSMRAIRLRPLVHGLLLATIVGIAGCFGGDGGDDSKDITIATGPDLAIVMTHVGNFTAGVNGAFTLTVSNVGAEPTAAAITVTDNVPAGLTVVAASGTGWNCSATVGQNVSCSHPGPLASGVSLPAITLTVNPSTTVGSPFNNSASVSTGGDGNTANNTASDVVTVNPGAPFDVMILKTHVGNFTVGVNGAFTLTVTNVGGTPTFGTITVADNVPAELTVVSAGGTGWNCSAIAGQNVSCSHSERLFPAASLPALTLTVIPNTATGSPFSNTASVSAAGDSNAGNNTAIDAVTVGAGGGGGPDLMIVKSHLTNFVVGVNGVYTFRVSNVGSAATSAAISITDMLQTGLAFVSASSTDASWDCSASAGVNVSCSRPGPLAVGASLANLDLTVSVGAPAVGTFNNVASVATAGDTNVGNNSSVDQTTVTVLPQPDLAIGKSHTGNFVVGTVGMYTIRVRNAGSAATTGAISVTDTLQTGLSFVSGTGTNWLCSAAGQTVTCNYQMPPATPPNPGEMLPDITLTVNVGMAAQGVFNNVAEVATPGDNNPANNTAVDLTVVP